MRELALTATLLLTSVSQGQQYQDGVPLDRLMSPTLQKYIGIDKLTEQEKERLRDYLVAFERLSFEAGKREGIQKQRPMPRQDTASGVGRSGSGPLSTQAPPSRWRADLGPQSPESRTPQAFGDPAPSPVPAYPSVIETRIDGEFEGWDGDTVFRLQNGQVWQQSSPGFVYHYHYSPEIFIYRSGPVFKMRVEGVDRTISVQRLK